MTQPDEFQTWLRVVGPSITKRIRMTPSEVETLAQLAKIAGTSESEVFREGLKALDVRRQRQECVEGLIAMTEGPEPKKIRWRPKY